MKITKNWGLPKDSIYSGRLIASDTTDLVSRLANGMCAACPPPQMVGLKQIAFDS